jgi:hypothetical protein
MQVALTLTFLSALASAIPAPFPSTDAEHAPLTNGEILQSVASRNKVLTGLVAATAATGAASTSSLKSDLTRKADTK